MVNPAAKERVPSIDVLRGISFVGMILVNTASLDRPTWLTHAGPAGPITFADTVFPCFLFTSGLSTTKQGVQGAALRRMLYLGAGGVAVNLAWRLVSPKTLTDFGTYRIPSVLGRIGLAGAVAALDFYLPKGVLPASLISAWYLLQGYFSGPNSFSIVDQSVDGKLDRAVFGARHLHNPVSGFDPEGLIGSVFTASASVLAGIYYRRWRDNKFTSTKSLTQRLSEVEPTSWALAAVPFAAHFIHASVTGQPAVPSSKVFWTPPYVLQTSALFVVAYEGVDYILRLLKAQQPEVPRNEDSPGAKTVTTINNAVLLTLNRVKELGRHSLELYLLSSFIPVFLKTPFFGYRSLWEVTKSGLTKLGLSGTAAGVTVSLAFTYLLSELAPLLEKNGFVLRQGF